MQAPGALRDKHAGLQRLQGEHHVASMGTLFCLSLSVAARGAGTGSDGSATAGVAGWGIDATTGRIGPPLISRSPPVTYRTSLRPFKCTSHLRTQGERHEH